MLSSGEQPGFIRLVELTEDSHSVLLSFLSLISKGEKTKRWAGGSVMLRICSLIKGIKYCKGKSLGHSYIVLPTGSIPVVFYCILHA